VSRHAPYADAATIPSPIYVIGRIEPRFPTLSLEKEAWQVIKREAGTAGETYNFMKYL
jgi:hypothetical protein